MGEVRLEKEGGVALLTLNRPERLDAIAVGGVDTASLEIVSTNEALRREFELNTPMCRFGSTEDIAACAVYLASPAAGWVTGKIFQIDGGCGFPAIRIPTPRL